MDLQALSDRAEITDLICRYATAVDRRDWNLYRCVFTPDARIDYTSAGGIAGSLDEVCRWLDETLTVFKATQHLVANFDISVSGDEATATAMFLNPMQIAGHPVWSTGGWYHHRLVRTARGWRSRRLLEESSWFDGVPEPEPEGASEVEADSGRRGLPGRPGLPGRRRS